MGMIERDDNHRYFKDGREIPGVHFILEITGKIKNDWKIPDHFLTRGKYIEDAVRLLIDGVLDENNLDKRLKPFIIAFKAFQKDTGVELINLPKKERFLYNRNPEYCGEYDFPAQFPGHKRMACLELKGGYEQPFHKYQNGMYCMALKNMDNVILWLRKDGTYKYRYYSALKQLAIEQKCRLILEKFYREFMNADLYGRPAASVPSPLQSPPIDEIPASAGAGSLKGIK
jgi:hypothetical protein